MTKLTVKGLIEYLTSLLESVRDIRCFASGFSGMSGRCRCLASSFKGLIRYRQGFLILIMHVIQTLRFPHNCWPAGGWTYAIHLSIRRLIRVCGLQIELNQDHLLADNQTGRSSPGQGPRSGSKSSISRGVCLCAPQRLNSSSSLLLSLQNVWLAFHLPHPLCYPVSHTT